MDYSLIQMFAQIFLLILIIHIGIAAIRRVR